MKIRKGFVSNSSSSSFIIGFTKQELYKDEKDFIEKITKGDESLQEYGKDVLKELWSSVKTDTTFSEKEVERYFQYECFEIFDDENLNEEFTKDVIEAAKNIIKTSDKYKKIKGNYLPYELVWRNNDDDKVKYVLEKCENIELIEFHSSVY